MLVENRGCGETNKASFLTGQSFGSVNVDVAVWDRNPYQPAEDSPLPVFEVSSLLLVFSLPGSVTS